LTCVGRKSYLVDIFGQSDRLGTLVAVDSDPEANIQFHAPHFATVPQVVSEPEAYAEALLELCETHDIDCIIPQNDLDLVALADVREDFRRQGVEITGAGPEVARAVRDKLQMADWMADQGLAYPKTWRPDETPSDAFPVIVKSRFGQGSAGLQTVDDRAELAGLDGDEVVAQQMAPGTEYNLDILCRRDGEVVSVVPKEKLEMRYGSTHKAESVDRPDLVELGVEVGEAVGHVGAIDVDVMVGADDTLQVIDINPRVGGGFPFTSFFCPAYVDALLAIAGGESPEPFLGDYEAGRRVDREFRYFECHRSE
jgi:carbamoyl-phosphate synthase large subunit